MSSLNDATFSKSKTNKLKTNSNPSIQRPCEKLSPTSSPNSATKNSRESNGYNQRRISTPTAGLRTVTTSPQSADREENVPLKSSSQAAHKQHVYRDSVFSLRDDPFFRNYTTPQSEVLARELRSASRGLNLGDAVTRPLSFNMAAAEAPVGISFELLEFNSVKRLLSIAIQKGKPC